MHSSHDLKLHGNHGKRAANSGLSASNWKSWAIFEPVAKKIPEWGA